MLDAFIIQRIIEEERKRREAERPSLDLPFPPHPPYPPEVPEDLEEREDTNQPPRGVEIIEPD